MRPRSIRASEAEWARWTRVAEARGFSLSAWARKLMTQEADRLEAEANRDKAQREERDRLLAVKRGDFDDAGSYY